MFYKPSLEKQVWTSSNVNSKATTNAPAGRRGVRYGLTSSGVELTLVKIGFGYFLPDQLARVVHGHGGVELHRLGDISVDDGYPQRKRRHLKEQNGGQRTRHGGPGSRTLYDSPSRAFRWSEESAGTGLAVATAGERASERARRKRPRRRRTARERSAERCVRSRRGGGQLSAVVLTGDDDDNAAAADGIAAARSLVIRKKKKKKRAIGVSRHVRTYVGGARWRQRTTATITATSLYPSAPAVRTGSRHKNGDGGGGGRAENCWRAAGGKTEKRGGGHGGTDCNRCVRALPLRNVIIASLDRRPLSARDDDVRRRPAATARTSVVAQAQKPRRRTECFASSSSSSCRVASDRLVCESCRRRRRWRGNGTSVDGGRLCAPKNRTRAASSPADGGRLPSSTCVFLLASYFIHYFSSSRAPPCIGTPASSGLSRPEICSPALPVRPSGGTRTRIFISARGPTVSKTLKRITLRTGRRCR